MKNHPIFLTENLLFDPEYDLNTLKRVYKLNGKIGYRFSAVYYGSSPKRIGKPSAGVLAYFWLKVLIDSGLLDGEIFVDIIVNNPQQNKTRIAYEIYAIVEELEIPNYTVFSHFDYLLDFRWPATATNLAKVAGVFQPLFVELSRYIKDIPITLDLQVVNVGLKQGTNIIVPFDIIA